MSDEQRDDSERTRDAPEVLRSDPQQVRAMRRWALAGVAVVAVTWLLFRYWESHSDAYSVLHRMYGLCYLFGIGLLAVAWYAVKYARRILDAGRYPPPGGWVLGDTPVLRGTAARTRGLLVIACAAGLALLGLYALYLPHIISTTLPPGTAPIQVDPSPGKPHG
ncbi:MAG TPA: hypothetical protein VGH80_14500 [Xanthomonadaceae bacterium]|jgi:hypothetical protein